MVISLTTTPMLCALFLKSRGKPKGPQRRSLFERVTAGYGRSLGWVLRHGPWVMLVLFATIGLNVYLLIIIPKGFFPQQDTGRLTGGIQADQSISFQSMEKKLAQLMDIVERDPAVGRRGRLHRRRRRRRRAIHQHRVGVRDLEAHVAA